MILQYNKKDCKNTDEIVFQCIFNENCNPVIVNKCNYFTRRETGHGCKTMIPAFLVSVLDNSGSREVVVTEQALSQCVQDCHKVHVCWKQKCLYNIQCPPKVWRQSYRNCSVLCCYNIYICIRTKQNKDVNDFYIILNCT